MAQHTGGLPGFVSEVTTIPDLRLGVAVFTNAESGAAFSAITFRILDYYMGAQFDWLAAFRWAQARGDSADAAEMKQATAARDSASKPSLPLARYAGTFRDKWYGDVAVTEENGKLVMRFTHTPVLVGTLEHWQYDTFIVRWTDREVRADAYVTYALNPDGSIANVKMAPASPDVDFSFDFQDLDLVPVAK